jgi:glycosyltransferase involved in cell wall biosynthesis
MKKKILFVTDWPDTIKNTKALRAVLDQYHSDTYEWHVWSCLKKQDKSFKYRWSCYFKGALYAIRNGKKYDAVFIWQQMVGFLVFEIKRFLPFIKIPKNIILYTFIYHTNTAFIKPFKKNIVGHALRYAKKLIWNSSQMADEVKHDFPKYKSKNSFAITPMFDIVNIGNHLDNSIDDVRFRNGVFAGGSSERDFNTVIKSFKNTNIPVTIVCQGNYVFTEREISSNIRILKNVSYDQFYALINQSFCVVVSLINERSSCGQLVVSYAMANSIPVIASDSCGVRDFISQNYNGLLFKAGNSRQLLNAYEKLKRDRQLRDRLVNNAGNIVEKVSPRKFIPKLISIVETA